MGAGTRLPITEDFLQAFVERYGAAWRSHDPDRIVAECTEDTTWVVPTAEGPLQGRDAVAEWLTNLFHMVPDASFEYPLGPPLLAVDGTTAAARFRITGTMTGPMTPPGFAPTDSPLRDEGIEIYERFADGRLARCTIVFDALDVARQIGAAPAPGSRAERMSVLAQRLQARRMRRAAGHAAG